MIRLLFFAQLADRAGVSEGAAPFAATAEALLALRPEWAFVKPSGARVAVNRTWARWDSPLQDGDEVAFLPPTSVL